MADRELPEYVQGLPAADRHRWVLVEKVYDAAVSYHPGEERTMTPFRDLLPEAQQAIIHTVLPLTAALHSVGLNPEAKAHD